MFGTAGDLTGGESLPGNFKQKRDNARFLSRAGYESRLEAARKLNKSNGIAIAANNLGLIAYREGNPDKALSYFEEALKARESMNERKGAALIKGEIGYVYYNRKQADMATAYFQSALQIMREEKMTKAIAITAGFLGESLSSQKNYAAAAQVYLEAQAAFASLGELKSAATLWHKAGQSMFLLRHDTDAAAFFNEELKIGRRLNDSILIARANRSLGYLYLFQDDYLKAEACLLTSLRFKPQAPLTEKYLKETYSKLAARYKVENNSEKTFYYTQRYQDLREKLSVKDSLSGTKAHEADEKENLLQSLRRENKQELAALSSGQLELKQQMAATELERLNREKAMEELNRTLNLSEKARIDRDREIEKLKYEKNQLDLILAQSEKELLRKTKNNVILLGATLLVLLLIFFLYNRYRLKQKSLAKLNLAYDELKTTQQQLIQSEKMASLGQLTAGIAHEIQNPLNFVNNFAELNADLLNELEQACTEEERKDLIQNLKQNFMRIHEHGKRADSIVKGMLAHSRASGNEKQSLDLNKLCDEFFNLAYHGMRAKDSSFNCTMEKKLFDGIPPVKLIQQDISRVLLNLLNNAFYAVNERAAMELQTGNSSYKPAVMLTTGADQQQAYIKVKDNGNGISPAIVNKIFHPFFTTKPSGLGTGLGLSLSHDIIVKGHQGSLTVISEENKGTEFTISLPLQPSLNGQYKTKAP